MLLSLLWFITIMTIIIVTTIINIFLISFIFLSPFLLLLLSSLHSLYFCRYVNSSSIPIILVIYLLMTLWLLLLFLLLFHDHRYHDYNLLSVIKKIIWHRTVFQDTSNTMTLLSKKIISLKYLLKILSIQSYFVNPS